MVASPDPQVGAEAIYVHFQGDEPGSGRWDWICVAVLMAESEGMRRIIWQEQQALSPCVLLRPEIAWMLCLAVFAFRRNPTFSRCEGVRGRELPTRPRDYHHSPVLVTQACFDRLVLMDGRSSLSYGPPRWKAWL